MARYAQCFQEVVGPATLNHDLTSANFCAFLTQDISGGDALRTMPRQHVSAKSATDFTITDPGAPGAASTSTALLVQAHGLIDIGPVIIGPARSAATQVFSYAAEKRLPSYRSLHSTVIMSLVQGALEGTIDITHLLGTTDVMVFVSPLYDPYDFLAGLPNGLVCWYNILNANQVRLHVQRNDGLGFEMPTRPSAYDVMVVALPNIGHSVLYHGGGNFMAVTPPVAREPSYHVGFEEVFILPTGGTQDLPHNLNGSADDVLIGLGELPATIGGGMPNVPYIDNRDVGGLGMTSRIGCTSVPDGLNRVDTLVIRSHSRVMGPLV